jgi:thiamine biosynthesis lipoprotein
MLKIGQLINKITDGHFDLNINRLISGYGYDKDLSFQENQNLINKEKGNFKLSNHQLIKEGDVELDLGGIGKGYLIDLLAKFFKKNNYSSFLIDGGGDIYATTKENGTPWNVAIEHPLDPTSAISQINLTNKAIATSSSQKRKVKNFHHLLDPKNKKPVQSVLSVSVLADSATLADACATAIFVSPPVFWDILRKKFNLEYQVVFPDLSYKKSNHFPVTSW